MPQPIVDLSACPERLRLCTGIWFHGDQGGFVETASHSVASFLDTRLIDLLGEEGKFSPSGYRNGIGLSRVKPESEGMNNLGKKGEQVCHLELAEPNSGFDHVPDSEIAIIIIYGQRRMKLSGLALKKTLRALGKRLDNRHTFIVDSTWPTAGSKKNIITKLVAKRFQKLKTVSYLQVGLSKVEFLEWASERQKAHIQTGLLSQFYSIDMGMRFAEDHIESKFSRVSPNSPIYTIRTDVFCSDAFPSRTEKISVSNFRHDKFDDNLVITPWSLRRFLRLRECPTVDRNDLRSAEDIRMQWLFQEGHLFERRLQWYSIVRKGPATLTLHLHVFWLSWLTRTQLPSPINNLIWSPIATLRKMSQVLRPSNRRD